uniref:Minichromosome maintenance complex component 3 associated protein n=1 Tax=Callorhinchus milii TaxID=7868 RepID=A0A4W3JB48_CALMI
MVSSANIATVLATPSSRSFVKQKRLTRPSLHKPILASQSLHFLACVVSNIRRSCMKYKVILKLIEVCCLTGSAGKPLIRRMRRTESSDSLAGSGTTPGPGTPVAELTAIQCKNIPEHINSKELVKQHFSLFGKVQRVYCYPTRSLAIVHFSDHVSDARVLSSSTTLPPGPVKKSDWSSSREEKEVKEEGELSSEEPMSFQYSPRPSSTMTRTSTVIGTGSTWSATKKPASSKSLQFEEGPDMVGERGGVLPASLSHLVAMVAESAEDKYRILDQRDKLMRQARVKSTDLEKARAMVGTCPDMCPEKERYMRETRYQLSSFELLPGTDKVHHEAAIKEYSRSSADQEEPLAHELRPATVLTMTMDYLMIRIMDMGEGNSRDWYDFVWNRTRGIRKDITQQHLCDEQTVVLIEQCTRFHIHCSHALCEEPMSSYDAKINDENLTKCLQSLKEMYQDLANKGIYCQTEAEFRSYHVLLNLNEGDILREAQQFRSEVRNSPEVKFAVQTFAALNNNNFVRFFKLVRVAPYLNACILHRYYKQVRREAVSALTMAHTVSSQRSTMFPLHTLARMLLLENPESAVTLVNHYGLIVSEGAVELNRLTLTETDISLLPKKSSLIEQKRPALVGEVVNGGRLPHFVPHIPVLSFDSQNRYVEENQEAAGSTQKLIQPAEGRCSDTVDTELLTKNLTPPGYSLTQLSAVPCMNAAHPLPLAFSSVSMASVDEMVWDVVLEILRQIVSEEVAAEQQRIEDEKDRMEQDRMEQDSEFLSCRLAVEEDRKARVARCSIQECSSLIHQTLDTEIFQVVKETLQELHCFCKYLKSGAQVGWAQPNADPECFVCWGFRLLWVRKETDYQMRIQNFHQQLLWDAACNPLDLASLVALSVPTQSDRIFWKLVLLLPSDEDDGLSDINKALADWLKNKFRGDGGVIHSLNGISTLSLLQQVVVLCCKHYSIVQATQGPLTEAGLEQAEQGKELLGTTGLLLLLRARTQPGDPAEEEVYWLSAMLQVRQVLQAKPLHPALPLVILVPKPHSPLILEEVQQGLKLEELVTGGLVSEYLIVSISGSTSDLQDTNRVSEAVGWLALYCPSPPNLCCQTLQQYVEDGLCRDFSDHFYSDQCERQVSGLPSQEPRPIIQLYNHVLHFLSCAVSSERLGHLSWPLAEFTGHAAHPILAHTEWNSGSHLAWLRDAVLSFQIPDMELPAETASWPELYDMILAYVSQIPASQQTWPLLLSRVVRVLNRVSDEWKEGNSVTAGLELAACHVPWDEIIALCIDHRLRDCSLPSKLCPTAVSEDGQILLYYFPEDVTKYSPPALWHQARTRTQRDIQQLSARMPHKQTVCLRKRRSVPPACVSNDSLASRGASAMDITSIPSAAELLPEQLLSGIESELVENRR